MHDTAAHHYSADRAAFQAFEPFREFVSGPIHAGTFGADDLDTTLGPEVRSVKAPPEDQANLPPRSRPVDRPSGHRGVERAVTTWLTDRDDTELRSTPTPVIRGGAERAVRACLAGRAGTLPARQALP
ncbi:hypothetical protein [uncultured Jannaschia sp.]|uniref:hypothetical protein n=1 Tax=uncultured Jannaschia sp. TaxID=293347 RepID=UPI002605839D|nr:hypothetical protein [uncultured Jannaschia sp.]